MVSLEQVKLLETKVIKTIEHVKKINEENSLLKGKLNSYQQRNDELEALIKQFKEDQGRIEDGILSALDRLNQFEDALDNNKEEPDSFVNNEEEDPPHVDEAPYESDMPTHSDPEESASHSDSYNPHDSEGSGDLNNPVKPQGPDNELDIF